MEEEEEARKMPEPDDGAGGQLTLETVGIDEEMVEEVMKGLEMEGEDYDAEAAGIEEEMVEEVMKGLEMELNAPAFLFPYSSSPFVTINLNEESCGPSFSDSSSTVMASIDIGDGAGVFRPSPDLYCETGLVKAEKEEEGSGGGVAEVEESEEEWLARVLESPAFEFEI